MKAPPSIGEISGPRATRSSDTYGRIVAAAIDEIYQAGYAAATMAAIARRAGTTRGAIQHHFGDRRIDLMMAACELVLTQREEAYATFRGLSSHNRMDIARSATKEAYRSPETWFLIEIAIAAKGDAELAEKLGDILSRLNNAPDALIYQQIADRLQGMDFQVFKYFCRCLTRGLALEHSIRPDGKLFDSVVDLAMDMLEGRAEKG